MKFLGILFKFSNVVTNFLWATTKNMNIEAIIIV